MFLFILLKVGKNTIGGILMIFIYIILIIIIIRYLVITFSTLRIDINELSINNKSNNYLIIIKLMLFNKITWFKLKINKEKIKKWQISKWNKIIDKITGIKLIKNFKNIQKIIFENWKEIVKENLFKTIKRLDININKLNLKLNIGTEDAILTSFIVATLYSIISVVLANTIKKFNKEKYSYLITPYYTERNFFEIELNCIINVKMVHIINMIKFLRKKESRFNERASNRRIDDNSNEQYTGYGRCKHNYWGTN